MLQCIYPVGLLGVDGLSEEAGGKAAKLSGLGRGHRSHLMGQGVIASSQLEDGPWSSGVGARRREARGILAGSAGGAAECGGRRWAGAGAAGGAGGALDDGRGPMPRPHPPTITGPTPTTGRRRAPTTGQRPVLPDGPHGRGPDQQRRHLRRVASGRCRSRDTGYTIASTQGYGVTLSGAIDASQTSGSSTLSLPVAFGTTAGTVTVDNTAATLAMGRRDHGLGRADQAGLGRARPDGHQHVHRGHHGRRRHAAGRRHVVGAVSVSSGATLGGMGTVGSITTTAATVSPGDSSTLTGILTDSGALTLDSSSNFDVTINGTTVGTNYDQLAAGGAINLADATLNVSIGSFTPVPGQHVHDREQHQRLGDHRHVRRPGRGGDGHGRRPGLHDQLQGGHQRPGRGADGHHPPHGHLVGDGRHRHVRPTTTGPTPTTGRAARPRWPGTR